MPYTIHSSNFMIGKHLASVASSGVHGVGESEREKNEL